jgi:SP family arabinose:H+ symporter-like MFS transporter
MITAIASLGGLVFGFDIAVISGVLPQVREQFHLSAAQEGWFVTSALVGCIVGVAFSGELSDRIGRKKLLIIAGILFLVSSIASALVHSLFWIISSRIFAGVGIGIASIVVPLYVSEISPAAVRGRLVSFYQLAITIGVVGAYLTNMVLLNYAAEHANEISDSVVHFLFVKEAWRGMLGVLILPSILFILGLWLVPESPRWQVMMGKTGEALSSFTKICGSREKAEQDITNIKMHLHSEKGRYKELLSPVMRRALLIGLMLPFLSQFSGINAIVYYGPTILHSEGATLKESLVSQIIFGLALMLFTFIAITKVDNTGRRKLYLIGTAGATVSLFLTGLCFHLNLTGSIWVVLSVMLFIASFAFSLGPLKFVVASEIYPNKIRGRALALSIMMMWIADAIVGQLTPISLRELGAAPTFWIFSFFCLVGFVLIYKLLPETKGKSLEEIDDFWKAIH